MSTHVTQEQVTAIMKASQYSVDTVFEKCTIVICKLPNGFVIVESSGAVSRENYDEKIGYEICMQKIGDLIWKMEGYKLACELHDAVASVASIPSIILP